MRKTLEISGIKTEFDDISSEVERTYVFPNDETIIIQDPRWLNVSESGGHRLITGDGVSHYIPPKWIHLYWLVKEGCPNFVR